MKDNGIITFLNGMICSLIIVKICLELVLIIEILSR